jgi:pseudoazurin
MRKLALTAALICLAFAPDAVSAAEFTVNMLNKDSAGRVMQFEPAFLKVAPGDTVHFVAVDKGHDTESIAAPEGAEAWKGKISQNLDVTFTVEGLYAYKCAPHLALGMVGLIQVGAAGSADAINALKLPGKAKTRMGELLSEQAAAP